MAAAKTINKGSATSNRGKSDAVAWMVNMSWVEVASVTSMAGSVSSSGRWGMMDVSLVLVGAMVVRVCLRFVCRGKFILNDCAASNNYCRGISVDLCE